MGRTKTTANRRRLDEPRAEIMGSPEWEETESPSPNPPLVKNKKRLAGESSSSYDAEKFRSPEHQQKFEEEMGDRALVLEKGFDLTDLFEHSAIEREVKKRKWEVLMTVPRVVNSQLVKEFYVNVYTEEEGEERYKSYVRGKTIKFDPKTLNKLLKIPEVENEYMELDGNDIQEEDEEGQTLAQGMLFLLCRGGVQWKTTADGTPKKVQSYDLEVLPYAWSNFVHHSLLPCANVSDIIVSRAYMLYCILTGKGVNVGSIIANNILATAKSSRNNAALIHPALIQWLCEKAKVKQNPSEPREKPAVSISAQWINSKYYSKRHAQQLNARDRESQPGPSSSSLPPEPQGMSMSDLRPLMESILANQREMREEQREMRAEQRELRLMSMGMQQDIQSMMQTQQRHGEMFMQMQAHWGASQAGFIPPPPSADFMETREEGDQPQEGGESGRFDF